MATWQCSGQGKCNQNSPEVTGIDFTIEIKFKASTTILSPPFFQPSTLVFLESVVTISWTEGKRQKNYKDCDLES
jgi:hypothetical protein